MQFRRLHVQTMPDLDFMICEALFHVSWSLSDFELGFHFMKPNYQVPLSSLMNFSEGIWKR